MSSRRPAAFAVLSAVIGSLALPVFIESPARAADAEVPRLLLVPGVPAAKPTAANFDKLRDLIRPQPGEAKWAEMPWLTSLTEARKVAAEQDKPLLIWAAGGGHQLGRC
jgi:hypothetical protein